MVIDVAHAGKVLSRIEAAAVVLGENKPDEAAVLRLSAQQLRERFASMVFRAAIQDLRDVFSLRWELLYEIFRQEFVNLVASDSAADMPDYVETFP